MIKFGRISDLTSECRLVHVTNNNINFWDYRYIYVSVTNKDFFTSLEPIQVSTSLIKKILSDGSFYSVNQDSRLRLSDKYNNFALILNMSSANYYILNSGGHDLMFDQGGGAYFTTDYKFDIYVGN